MAALRNATLLVNATMRAVVWQGQPQNVAVVNLPMPTIQSPTDAIVRVTAAGICGTDLHTYRGHYGSQTPPWPMGHEAMGQILEVGEAVSSLQVGDPVVVSDVAQEAEIVGEDSVIYPFGMGPDRGDLGGCQSKHEHPIYTHTMLHTFTLSNADNDFPANRRVPSCSVR